MNELRHLAIIMDGNGRWAKKRILSRSKGHEAGAKVVEDIAIFCAKKGIKTLSLYAFSTENWKRPQNEVEFLMKLLKEFLISKEKMVLENNIKFHTIGDISVFSSELKEQISQLKAKSENNSGLNLVLALNYGARDELSRACAKLAQNGEQINEQNINSALDTASFGDVDLLIRTGGEQRLSNFLLWQASYAQLVFTPTLWPDFSADECQRYCDEFSKVHRRFGGL